MAHSTRTDFEYDNNYNIKNGFTRVKYGNNRKILETELNEMQKIQEETRAALIRQIAPSGFAYLKRADINLDVVICNPKNEENTIALAPSKLFLNGYEVTVEGNESFVDENGYSSDGYLKIKLPNPPTSLNNEHFVFLECWFEELTGESTVRKYGYEEGEILYNAVMDGRVNAETSRRVGLRWRIRIVEDHNFERWENGFGYVNDVNFASIYGYGKNNSKIENLDLVFRSATENIFKDCDFYGDNGLWVAGRPWANGIHDYNSTNYTLGIEEDYVFAVPLLRIKRRNITEYSITNSNGASTWIDESSVSAHPDKLFNNHIVPEDIIDMRRSISFSGWNYEQMLNQSLKDLLTGKLETYKKEVMHRAQFGVQQILSTDENITFLSRFNGTTKAEGDIDPNNIIGDQNVEYGLGSSGQGLVLNGKSAIEYVLPVFNKIRGGVDFFFRPFWGSNDITSTQTIFSILDSTFNTKVYEFKKNQDKISFTVKRNNSGLAGDTYSTDVSILDNNIFANKLYHVRIIWEYGTSTTTLTGGDRNGSILIYLNGRLVQSNNYTGTDLNPTLLRVGESESYNTIKQNPESIVDEFIVYDDLVSGFKQLSEDFANNTATLYPSFNGAMNSFKDNSYKQDDFVKEIITQNDATTLKLPTFRGSTIDMEEPTVYNDKGEIYTGAWQNLGSKEAIFTLTSTPAGNTIFTGETVYVKHNLLISAGNGIFELPTKILKAEINGKETSFNEEGAEPRLVVLEDGNGSYNSYDLSTNTRTSKDAHARIIYYKIKGNGQDRYSIPSKLFGYDVIGISYVSRRYDRISKIANDVNKLFEIELTYALLDNQEVEVHVMLGGTVFDYTTYTKSIVSNTLKTTTLKVTAPGNTEVFKLKLDVNAGFSNVVAVGNITRNTYDTNGVTNGIINNFVAYKNGLQVELVGVEGFGTPFLTIEFSSTPLAGEVIEIPVLATYSLSTTDIVSIWFKHVPYQGILDNETTELQKLTNWIPFVTTLSSGNLVLKNTPAESINNAFNRLPGGGSFTHMLTGENINFKNESYTNYNGDSPNKKFVLVRDAKTIVKNDELDSYFFELDSKFTIKKLQKRFQDGGLEAPFNINGFHIHDTEEEIVKYGGSACLVADNDGKVMLFVMGHTHNFEKVTSTLVKPEFADLFYLERNPTILIKK